MERATSSETSATPDERSGDESRMIDPWGSDPSMRSRILGLGGDVPPTDPALVFCTGNFSVSPGPLRLEIRISRLRTEAPFMFLELLNGGQFEGGAMTRLALIPVELAQMAGDRPYVVEINAYANIRYALGGFIHGEELVHADLLSITADRPVKTSTEKNRTIETIGELADEVAELDETRTTARIISNAQPSFGELSSQPFTSDQLACPQFRSACEKIGIESSTANADEWCEAFVVRALEVYNPLKPGALGLGLGCDEQRLWPFLLRSGASLLLLRQSTDSELCIDLGQARDELLEAYGFRDARYREHLDLSFVDHALPAGLRGRLDFAWWVAPHNASRKEAIRNATIVLDSVRPGGLATIVVRSRPTAMPAEDSGLVCSNDVLRIALDAASRGYQIAQIRIPSTEGGGMERHRARPFGLIARRVQLPRHL